MKMSNHDLDWLAAQQPQRMEIDHGARERALLALVEHSSRTGERGFRLGSQLRTRMFGFAAATGAAAIAAVLVLSTAGSSGGAASAGRLSQRARGPQVAVRHHGSSPLVRIGQSAGGPQVAVHHDGTANSPLVRLAAYVSASPTPAGDATLVARTTTSGGGSSVTVYDLYADDGQYFFSPTESALAGQVSAHHNLADGSFAHEIAAAKLAATGDVQTGAQDMADAPDPGHVISPTETAAAGRTRAAKQAATGMPQEGNLYDNWVWENSQDALIAGSGDPQVRAGVLRILATLPGVTVTNGTSGGQPTLVLTAGSSELGYGYTEQLTIGADSGVPLEFIGGSTGGPSGTVDYQVSRVTLANPIAELPSGAASSD
jgi:hypothetical protein